jgi:hypothetical protein
MPKLGAMEGRETRSLASEDTLPSAKHLHAIPPQTAIHGRFQLFPGPPVESSWKGANSMARLHSMSVKYFPPARRGAETAVSMDVMHWPDESGEAGPAWGAGECGHDTDLPFGRIPGLDLKEKLSHLWRSASPRAEPEPGYPICWLCRVVSCLLDWSRLTSLWEEAEVETYVLI